MYCSTTIWSYASNVLQTFDFSDYIKPNQIPKRHAVSFGSIYSAFGSVGFTNIGTTLNDPFNLQLQMSNANISFSETCGLRDYAFLDIPITSMPSTVDMEIRVSGLGTVYPSQAPTVTQHATVKGILHVAAPMQMHSNGSPTVLYSEIQANLRLYASWTFDENEWPPTTETNQSILFQAIPFDTLLAQYTTSINSVYRPIICKAIVKLLQKPNAKETCIVPVYTPQTISGLLAMPTHGCNACDTKCKCAIKQICDGNCSEFASVVKCKLSSTSITEWISLVLICIFALSYTVFAAKHIMRR